MDYKAITVKIKKKVNGVNVVIEVKIYIDYEDIVAMYQAKSEIKKQVEIFVDRHYKEIVHLNGSINEYFIDYLNECTNYDIKDVDVNTYKVKQAEMEM